MESQQQQRAPETDFNTLLLQVEQILGRTSPLPGRLAALCRLLRKTVPHYNWVGIYLVESPGWLVLGPYDGAPTGHVRIPFGQGICGQVAASGETLVVPDVSTESNYLSCNVAVRSEIVVPLLLDGTVLGELDIDSHRLAPFTPADRTFLEAVCARVAQLLP